MNSLAKTYCTAVDIFQRGLIGTIIFFKWTLAKNMEKPIFSFLQKKKKKRENKKKIIDEKNQ